MKTIYRLLKYALLCAALTNGKATAWGAEVVPGEYIVNAEKSITVSMIQKKLKNNSLVAIKPLAANQFLLKFDPDPGLPKIEKKLKSLNKKITIQNNLVYSVEPPATEEHGKKKSSNTLDFN